VICVGAAHTLACWGCLAWIREHLEGQHCHTERQL